MTKYRDHRGSLVVSMETVREFDKRADLIAYLRADLAKYSFDVDDAMVNIEYYADDDRIGWHNTHIVTIDSFGVVGFTDGPLRS